MSYCQSPINSDVDFCNSCGSELVLMGRYRAISPIGQGGFGRTFLAIDTKQATKLRCVIKQFAPQNKANLEQAAELFRQEALRLAELGKHNQIPALLAYGEQAEYQYLVQEFIDGQNLAQELANREPYSQAEVEQILRSLLDVLNFVPSKPIVLRSVRTFAIMCESDEPYQRLPEMSDSFLFNNIDNASCPTGFSKVRDW